MLYWEAELCFAASTFGRGGILSENLKDGKVTVHSAKNTNKFDSTVGRFANHADQTNLGVAGALRSSIYGGVPRVTSLTTTVSGGPDADDCAPQQTIIRTDSITRKMCTSQRAKENR